MSQPTDHFCPGCGTAMKIFLRYPWHFCDKCRKTAASGTGRVVECSNVGMSGGFQWRYAGTDEWMTCRGLYCLIQSRDVYLSEARFGGIVAQPILSHQMPEDTKSSFRDMDIRKD
ncbi:hypothetical protein [Litoreibacter janthinus]|uniref:ADP-ribosylglycohydrolase n=1 Tax=Litoreibacter janthinus TaxID=670154 RepID=A0A1I6FWR0_9RHOB|nr:hypothetical protein [Litoreibacter janthinus]SFR34383.1 hypothetical protein SAMN04488002_0472 [Litoreibacter janthinus]